jgi:hypothetical protein
VSAFPVLDVRHASWDKFRGAVVIPSGVNQVAVSLEALESWANKRLTPEEAIETAVDEKALFAAIANATPEHDNVITITAGILNSRSWGVEDHDDGPHDSGPIYLEPLAHSRGEKL